MMTILFLVLLLVVFILTFVLLRKTFRLKEEKKENERKMAEMLLFEKMKGDFLTIAQHQLRTPLSGVRWALEMLKNDEKISLESQSLVDESILRINDAIKIVNEMITTAEESDIANLKIEPVDIAGMIQAIVAELNFNIVRKEVKLRMSLPDSLMINADRAKLKPAMLNIIDNAIIYSPQGTVDVILEEGENAARLTVKDTGIGITDEDKQFLFERMHRGANAMKLEPSESGVGLTITKKIVDLHKGTINIESQLGKGTTVTIILPKKS